MEAIGDAGVQKPVLVGPSESELLDAEMAVSWVMSREVVSVRPDLLLTSLESLLITQDLSRVPVIDDAGTLLGIVSKTDLVTLHMDQADAVDVPPARIPGRKGARQTIPGFHTDAENGETVTDVMCQTVLTVGEQTTIARAAELMAVHRVHGLPVVAPNARVIGWISALDIVSWVAGIAK